MAITRGEEGALQEAYGRHGSGVYAVARRLCGNVRADDLVQEIFLALWRRPEAFDPARGSLGGYLTMQAHTRSIDLLRSDTARRTRELKEGQRQGPLPQSTEATAMDHFAADALDRALAQIPALQREVIVMAFFGGHTYKEVAELLGQPEGTVKTRVRAGLARLRVLLDDGSGGEDPLLFA
jgi:RNA polymerase sigma-70 factor (ECF subfamily)